MTKTKATYTEIQESEIPAKARFDVPRHNQGQIVEIAYGGFDRSEHGHGDLYKRVIDRSEHPGRNTTYYKLSK